MVIVAIVTDQSSKLNSAKLRHEKELILISEEKNSLQEELEGAKVFYLYNWTLLMKVTVETIGSSLIIIGEYGKPTTADTEQGAGH